MKENLSMAVIILMFLLSPLLAAASIRFGSSRMFRRFFYRTDWWVSIHAPAWGATPDLRTISFLGS